MPSFFKSAEWVETTPGNRVIKAIGDDDSVWFIPEVECDVPPWPDFLETATGKAFVMEAKE